MPECSKTNGKDYSRTSLKWDNFLTLKILKKLTRNPGKHQEK